MNAMHITGDAEVPAHQTVRSLVKATRMLLCIADSDGLMAAQVAKACALPLGTAYNLLNTLLAEGMLSRDSARRYALGPKVAVLSLGYARRGPSEQTLLLLRQLAESTGETAYMSVWRTGEVVAVAAIEGSSAVRVGRIHTELRGHEHARASGKVMLAQLEPRELDAYLATHPLVALTPSTTVQESDLRGQLQLIRRTGVAVDLAEFTPGVGCVSAPIWQGRVCVAACTLAAPLERMLQHRPELERAVREAAEAASNA
jgi:IclR family transcriptional regulator, acetate operon repressor